MNDVLNYFTTHSWLATYAAEIAAICFFIVRLYRHPDLQASIPFKYQWENLPVPLQQMAIWAAGAFGGASVGLTAHLNAIDGIVAAVAGTLAATLAGKLTRTHFARLVAAIVVPPATQEKLSLK